MPLSKLTVEAIEKELLSDVPQLSNTMSHQDGDISMQEFDTFWNAAYTESNPHYSGCVILMLLILLEFHESD